MKQGLTQIFWGDGKGKTTSALGASLRACGNGYKVYLIQFLKNGATGLKEEIPGEIKALKKFPNFHCKRFGTKEWVIKKVTKSQIKSCKEALQFSEKILTSNKADIVILDEILYAVQLNLLKEEEIVNLIEKKPIEKELILTGSHKPLKKIFEKADLISHIKKIKHPFDKGILARKGIEF